MIQTFDQTRRKLILSAYIAAIPFGLCFAYYPIQSVITIVGLLLAVFIATHSPAIIYLLFTLIYSIEWLAAPSADLVEKSTSLGLCPKISVASIEIVSMLLLLICLPKIIKLEQLFIIFSAIIAITTLYISYSLFQEVPLVNIALGLRQYLRSIPIFFAGYLLAREGRDKFKGCLKFLFFIASLQIPVAIYQYIYLLPQANPAKVVPFDLISGTFGGLSTDVVAFYLLGVISFLLVMMLITKAKWYYWLFIPFFLIQSVLGEVKVAFICFIILFFEALIFVRAYRRRVMTKKIILLFLCIALIVGFNIGYARYRGSRLSQSLLVALLMNKSDTILSGTRLSRMGAIKNAWYIISEHPMITIFGAGLGTAMKNLVSGKNGKHYERFSDRHFANKLIIELGICGIIIVILLMLKLFRLALFVKNKSYDIFDVIMASGFILILSLMVISFIYDDAFTRAQTAYPFWMIAGYLYKRSREIKALRVRP